MNKKLKENTFPFLQRFLHWVIALLMFVLFFTGFLRMYWMSKKTIVSAIDKNLMNVDLTKDQMVSVARGIIKPMWQWHELAAYFLSFFFVIKLGYMFWKGIKFPNPFNGLFSAKQRIQGFVYLVFYLFMIVTIVTGGFIKWGDRGLKETMEYIHKLAIYWFPVFFIIHLLGIWIAELTNKKGLVSNMIGGNEK